MLTATFSGANTQSEAKYINIKFESPWLKHSRSQPTSKVAIIGAGIAGCATAYQLALKGFKVDLFDSEAEIANKASGAAAGIFHPQLTSDMNISSQFNWLAYLHLLRLMQTLTEKEKSDVIHSQSITRLLPDTKSQRQLLSLVQNLRLEQWISQSAVVNCDRAIDFPFSAALNMRAFCELLFKRIPSTQKQLFLNHEISDLERSNGLWQFSANNQDFSYQHIVLCGGANSPLAEQFITTPTNQTRGQTCIFESELLSQSIKKALCEQTYLVPRKNNQFHLGTTFEDFVDDNLSQKSQDEMFEKTSLLFKNINKPFLSQKEIQRIPLKGTLGYRRHSTDRLPIIGGALDLVKLEKDFNQLGQKRLRREDLSFYNRPGLWINTAYGSHGLVYSLLGSHHLASLIANDLSPISCQLSAALSPTRFNIRLLKQAG